MYLITAIPADFQVQYLVQRSSESIVNLFFCKIKNKTKQTLFYYSVLGESRVGVVSVEMIGG